jgi:nucleoside-diphosphate-sugar epimerase
MSSQLQGRKIALIGGAGFIGHNLALSLAKRGARVEIVDSLQVNNLLWFVSGNGKAANRDIYARITNERLDLLREAGIPVHIQDSRDYHAMSRIMDQLKPQVIVHLAAVSHAGRSNKDPYNTFDHSLRTLENTLDCARDNVEQFIFFSSSMVYGNFLNPEVDEEHPLEPIGIYGALKVAGEKIVIAYQQVFDLPYTIIRPSALYGPRCVSRRVGQVFIENAIRGEQLRIEGDGSEKLDFTYIDDVVDGICLMIESPNAQNQIFNLTYGDSRSIEDLVNVVREYFPEVDAEYIERDNLRPFRGTLSIEKAKRLVGYSPKNPIEVGLPKYVQWYRELYERSGLKDLHAA